MQQRKKLSARRKERKPSASSKSKRQSGSHAREKKNSRLRGWRQSAKLKDRERQSGKKRS